MDQIFDLTQLVLNKIEEIGNARAAEYFSVSTATISAWRTGKNLPSIAAGQKVFNEACEAKPPELWDNKGKKVQLLLPIYEAFTPFSFFTLFKCISNYGRDKVGVMVETRTLIDESRCTLADRFLQTDSEWCIMMDADMILPCGSPGILNKIGLNIPVEKGQINAVERIMSHPPEYKIIGAVYRDRRGRNKAQCASAFGSSPTRNAELLSLYKPDSKDKGELQEEGWVALGFSRIHRSVFEQMREAAKPGGPLEEIAPFHPGSAWGYFGRSAKWRGEDTAFCRRAQIIGIRSFIDTSILCGHEGRYVY